MAWRFTMQDIENMKKELLALGVSCYGKSDEHILYLYNIYIVKMAGWSTKR